MAPESGLILFRSRVFILFLLGGFVLSALAWGKDSTGEAGIAETRPISGSVPGTETVALRDQLSRQQARIEQLEQALERLTRRLDQLEGSPQASGAAPPQSAPVAGTSAALSVPVSRKSPGGANGLIASAVAPPAAALPAPMAALARAALPAEPLRPQADSNKPQSAPLSFKIGGAEFMPGGFLDFTTVFRSTDLGSGVATSFGTIPYSVVSGAPNPTARLTELRSLAQNSRISLKITSQVGGSRVAGYVESDFAGNNPSSLFVTSNSSTLRLRHYFVQIERGKWELVGGQAWTLMTPGRTGISPWPSDVFLGQGQDSNYQLGITWGRQSQLRLVYHPSRQWAAALSIENPNQYLSTGVVLPSASFTSQFDMAGNQTTTPNLRPDIVAKVAFDPSTRAHVELGGITRTFRTFNSANNSTSIINGGGVTAGVNFEVMKNFRLMANGFYGYGGGRYILGLGPDVIVKPDGTLSGVHAASGVAGFEYQVNPKVLFFGYYGGAYFQRNTGYSLDSTGKPVWVGFGAPTTAATELNANRAVQEPTFGVTRIFWKSPKFGSLLWVNQYSYVTRAPWIVPSGSGKDAHLSAVFTDLRYVLP